MLNVGLNGLEPHTYVNLKVFSDPIDLGVYEVDSMGNLTANIAIPENLPAGMHRLEIAAKTFFGEEVVFWQPITVYGREGDIDENGISDDQQQCFFVEDSGIDEDEDNIDDGCDPLLKKVSEDNGSVNYGIVVAKRMSTPVESSRLDTVSIRRTTPTQVDIPAIFRIPSYSTMDDRPTVMNNDSKTAPMIELGVFVVAGLGGLWLMLYSSIKYYKKSLKS